jgi:hypothetical protein
MKKIIYRISSENYEYFQGSIEKDVNGLGENKTLNSENYLLKFYFLFLLQSIDEKNNL